MSESLKNLGEALRGVADKIDAGNSKVPEGENIALITDIVADTLKKYSAKDNRLSKYQACEYLNMCRATFDSYMRAGKIPRGKHTPGWKEEAWFIEDLDKFKAERHADNKRH